MLSSNYIAATHNTTHSMHINVHNTTIPSSVPSTTPLCTQLTNIKHSWQNGTRCRDGVNVLWCRSHLVWLVFERFIPTCACFHLENFFVTFTLSLINCNSFCIMSVTVLRSKCQALLSLVPRLVCGLEEKSLVHTVCACSIFPGFLGIWKFP